MNKQTLILLATLIFQSCNSNQLFTAKDQEPATEDKSEPNDLGAVNEPVMVAGSFLVCGQPESPIVDSNSSLFACRVEDENGLKDTSITPSDEDIIASHQQIVVYGEAQSEGDWHWLLFHNFEPGVTFQVKLVNPAIQVANPEIEFTHSLPTDADQPTTLTSLDCSNLQGGIFLAIPGNQVYSTSDFCVMKYEAKDLDGTAFSQAEGLPWTTITQANAKSRCEDLGNGYGLINNSEFLTIAINAASIASNWSGGIVGSGQLNRGHSDGSPSGSCPASSDDSLAFVETNCTPRSTGSFAEKRTHLVSTGEMIWDLAGNVWHWVDYIIPDNSNKPFASTRPTAEFLEWRQLSEIDSGFETLALELFRPTQAAVEFWNDIWDSRWSVGQYLQGSQGAGGVMRRGGRYSHGNGNGLFAVSLDVNGILTNDTTGFRCVYRPAP